MLQNIIASAILLIIVHELGHIVVAAAMGKFARVSIEWQEGKIRLPYICIWLKDDVKDWQYRLFGAAGFGASIICASALVGLLNTRGAWVTREFILCYLGALNLHWWTYPFRHRNSAVNDFNKMDADEDPAS